MTVTTLLPTLLAGCAISQPAIPLDGPATARFEALRTWRAEVARERSLPAYVIFHDKTLAEIARRNPVIVGELGGISGVGQAKLASYGADVLRVLATVAA